ncbi:MAG: CoA transferase [Betaproteobacteria bacterium]|nr:CoA transferase [Betaproteobacteria bacterium]
MGRFRGKTIKTGAAHDLGRASADPLAHEDAKMMPGELRRVRLQDSTDRNEINNGSEPKGPLDGIRVLDMTTMILGPVAAQSLGDMGADVIKVETTEGDLSRRIGPRHSPDMGAFYLNSNRNKRSIVLDLKKREAQPVFERLVRSSDVVICSIRTDAAERLGLTYQKLCALNAQIILCHVKGYADDGPYGGQPAYDDVAQAVSGLAVMQSAVAGEPRYVPTIIADKVTGLQAAYAISLAICHRLRTGQGQEISVPMFETMVAFNMTEHLWGEIFVPPLAGTGYTPISTVARRPFKTSDGYLCVLPYTDQHWARFCEVVGDPALAADPRYATHAARQSDQMGFWNEVANQVRRKSTAEWIEALTAANVPFGLVNSFDDLLTDPHLESVGFWQTLQHPTEGALRMMTNPIAMSASPTSIRRLPPRLGEHSTEILHELGFGPDDIAALTAQGVIGPGPTTGEDH